MQNDHELGGSRVRMPYNVRQVHLQGAKRNRSLNRVGELDHLLLSHVDDGLLVGRIVASLGDNVQ